MKILILGSEGFIGTHCIDFFTGNHHEVSGIDLFEQPIKKYDYTKVSRLSPELDEVFSRHTYDAVVNASGSGNVPYSMDHPLLDFEANSLDTILVLDSMRKHQPACKYLHISSAAVYGNPVRLPIQESAPASPLSPYGWHKLISELLCKEYHTVFGLPVAIARPFSVYGPGLKKQMFWDVYQKVKTHEKVIPLLGTGEESRDYIYIDDLIHAIDLILHNGSMQSESYNIASGIETTIHSAITTFMQKLGASVVCEFGGYVRAGDPVNWRADVSAIQKLGFQPKVGLNDGLTRLADWIVNY